MSIARLYTLLTILTLLSGLPLAYANSHNGSMLEIKSLTGTDYKKLPHLISPDGMQALAMTKSKAQKECLGGENFGEQACPWDVLVLYDVQSAAPIKVLAVNSFISSVQWFPDNKRVLYTKREGVNNYQTTIIKNVETDESSVIGHSSTANIIKSCDWPNDMTGNILVEKSSIYAFGGRYWWYEIVDAEGKSKGKLPGESRTEAPSRQAADSICTYMGVLDATNFKAQGTVH